jgi:hypothetical protein
MPDALRFYPAYLCCGAQSAAYGVYAYSRLPYEAGET